MRQAALLLAVVATLAITAFTVHYNASVEAETVQRSCQDDLGKLPFTQFVSCLEYPVETHTVTTEDGYQLTVYRIQAKNTKITGGKPVVLFWHGLFDSAVTWILNEENLAPALVMANLGYDIWLGNSRGNSYSLGHNTLDHTKDTKYWEFSWQEMSENDLPAAFPYIAKLTGEKINYIGHSQGTTQMFAALSNPDGRNPAIINHLRKFAALGPVTHLGHVQSELFLGLAKIPFLPEVLKASFKFGLFMPNWQTSTTGRLFCTYLTWACAAGISLVADVQTDVDNTARLGIVGGHFPAGTSVQDLLHWKQAVNSGGKFQKYDYGTEQNMKVYGQSSPPLYDATAVTDDIAMFVGDYDELATRTDETQWYNEMTNAKKQIHFYDMGHLTFMLGKELTYWNDLLNFLDLPKVNANVDSEMIVA